MKKFFAVSVVSAVSLMLQAQTAGTGASSATIREFSLKDCIQTALKYNYDVQIQRESVDVQLYDLHANYGGFDPTLNLSGKHSHSNTLGYQTAQETNGTVLFVPASLVGEGNLFQSDVGGTSPWGMQYDFFGNVSDSKEFEPGVPEEESSGGQVGVTVTQPLLKNLWIDTTRLNILLTKNSLSSSEQGLRQQFINTVAAVQNAYFELIYAQENVQVQEESLKLAQTQLDQDKQRVEVGSLAPLDVQQDESQAASSQAALIAAKNTLSLDQNTLKALLITDYSKWHDTTIMPNEKLSSDLQLFDLQECWDKGLKRRPDLIEAKLALEAQGITIKYDQNQIYPLIDINGQYGYNGDGRVYGGTFDQYGEANHPFYYYGASISIPLSNVRARSTLKADKATLHQKLLTLKELEQNIMVQIDNAVQQVESDYQGIQASKEARIYAEAALDAEQKKYNVGKSTTFTVLQLQNTLTSDRGAEIRSIANYDEDLAKLSQQEGSTLEDLNINVEVK